MRKSTSGRSITLKLLAGASMLSILATLGLAQPGISAGDAASVQGGTGEQPLTLSSRTETKQERLKKLDRSKLHRLDFRVTGSGCAACLGRIRKRIDKVKGVYEVAVAIKPPYGVAVIYDSSKTTKEEILEEGKKGEKTDVFFKDIKDAAIGPEPPIILIPIFNSLMKQQPTSGD